MDKWVVLRIVQYHSTYMCTRGRKGHRDTMRIHQGVLRVVFLAALGLAAKTAAVDAEGRLTTKTYHGRSPPSLSLGSVESPSLTRAVRCRGGKTACPVEGAALFSSGQTTRAVTPPTKLSGSRGWGQLRRSPESATELVPRGDNARRGRLRAYSMTTFAKSW